MSVESNFEKLEIRRIWAAEWRPHIHALSQSNLIKLKKNKPTENHVLKIEKNPVSKCLSNWEWWFDKPKWAIDLWKKQLQKHLAREQLALQEWID